MPLSAPCVSCVRPKTTPNEAKGVLPTEIVADSTLFNFPGKSKIHNRKKTDRKKKRNKTITCLTISLMRTK